MTWLEWEEVKALLARLSSSSTEPAVVSVEDTDYTDLPPDLRSIIDTIKDQTESPYNLAYTVAMARQVHSIRENAMAKLPVLLDGETVLNALKSMVNHKGASA